MAIAANVIIVILELIGLTISVRRRGWRIFEYYTQISNLAALLSSAIFLLAGGKAAWLRFVGTCMLVMTFAVTLFILVPMGAGFKKMMLASPGRYLHTLCPILSTVSYLLWEGHESVWYVPVILTFLYGMLMLYLNWKGRVDGPYPFFRVRHQSGRTTVLRMAALTAMITLISLAVTWITDKLLK